MMTLAIALTRSWVRLYTLGLPAALRDARRAEIESDLWEQGYDGESNGHDPQETGLQVLFRLLAGLPADLAWRLETGLSRHAERNIKVNESLTMRGLFIAAVAIAIVPAAMGVAVIAGGGEFDSTTGRMLFGSFMMIAAVTMVTGLVLSARTPRLGVGLVALGAIGMAVIWFWIPFITIPLGAGLVFLAYGRARRQTRERDRLARA